MKIKILALIIITIFGLISSCKDEPDNLDKGDIKESIYYNDYFGIKIPIGNNWIVQGDKENRKMIERAKKLIANGDKNVENNIETEMKENVVLLHLANRVDSLSSIVVFAEKETGFFWLPTSIDKYILQIKSLLDHTPLDYSYLDKKTDIIVINNTDWRLLKTKYQIRDKYMFQDFLIYKKNGYFLSVISTYSNLARKPLNDKLIEKIEINN